MAWQDFAQQKFNEGEHRYNQSRIYDKLDDYGQGLWRSEARAEGAWSTLGKAALPLAAGYGAYYSYGLGGLAVAGGLYGAKKGFDFVRHSYAQGIADNVFNGLQNEAINKGIEFNRAAASQAADRAYKSAARNFKWHPGYWARRAVGGTLRTAGRGAWAAAKGVASAAPSVAIGAGIVGARIAKGVWNTLRIGESVARTVLTGGAGGTRPGMSAWFPYFNSLPKGDFRRFVMNPRVGSRLAIGAVTLGLISGASDLLTKRYHGPPPTVYYDGVSVHHIDEMGANAEYAAKVLGPNSAYARSLYPVADEAVTLLGRAALIR